MCISAILGGLAAAAPAAGVAATLYGIDQSRKQANHAADAQAKAYDYTKGQTMVLDLAAPDYDAYLYVDFFAADGTVIAPTSAALRAKCT